MINQSISGESWEAAVCVSCEAGDYERVFDGLVGYVDAVPEERSRDPIVSDLDLGKLFTYFTATTTPQEKTYADPREEIKPMNYPKLEAYHIPSGRVSAAVSEITASHNKHLRVFGMLVDPFKPVYAYSAILPNQSLTLHPWMVELALNRIKAFFHVGPIVVTRDVPAKYNTAEPLTAD
ncbi:hypothetical protein K440DRAFT_35743 [Wilcoxina mikolae CBS 423.85]|nr:hypothetical protein K440DRAFT_35743 [Wilcoxina mikolae CBS 423.85]